MKTNNYINNTIRMQRNLEVMDNNCHSESNDVQYNHSNIFVDGDLTYGKKTLLSLKRELTIKEIMALYEVGQPTATKIRCDALKYCNDNNIKHYGRCVPTKAVIAVTGEGTNLFLEKETIVNKLLELKGANFNAKTTN